jgi:hypothetical protein
MFNKAALLALLPLLAAAQDGVVTGPTSSPAAAGYSCDATKCKLPNCNCASTNPPGGLNVVRNRNTQCGSCGLMLNPPY